MCAVMHAVVSAFATGLRRVLLAAAFPALLLCGGAAGSAPSGAASVSTCLQAWDITWKHPYFPQFERADCPVEAAAPAGAAPTGDSATFTGLSSRRQKISLSYRADWLPTEAPGRGTYQTLRREGARLALVHIEGLLLAQKFARLAGPPESTADSSSEGYPQIASFQKPLPGGLHRIDVHALPDRIEIVLEQRGSLRAGLELPKPTDAFDMTLPGVNSHLFAIPGMKLVEETAHLENVLVRLPVEANLVRERNVALVWAPVRRFKYQHERKIARAELDAALRELLLQAGWKFVTDSPLTRSSGYRYTLPGRQLELSLRSGTEQDGAPPFAMVTVADPSFWESVLPLLDQGGNFDKWEIAPQFDGRGEATAATAREIFVYTVRTSRVDAGGERLLVLPVVAPESQNDPAAVSHARASARWVRDQMVRHRFAASQIRLMEEVRAPSLPAFKVKSGAHVSWFSCNTQTQTRPDGNVQTCECRADFGVVSKSAGACK